MALEDIAPHLKAGFHLVAKAKSDLKQVGIDTAQLLPAQMLKMASDERHGLKRHAATEVLRKAKIKLSDLSKKG